MIKYGIHHNHTMYSLNDSALTPDALVARAKALGAENITLTDHGTLLGVEPFMDAGEKYGVNTIPGVEAYLEGRAHLCIVAMDAEGYRAICHAVRDANAHAEVPKWNRNMSFPIMSDDILERHFKGNAHIFATTACVAGPAASILLRGYWARERDKKEMEKLAPLAEAAGEYARLDAAYRDTVARISEVRKERAKQAKYTKPAYAAAIKKVADAEAAEPVFVSRVPGMEALRDGAIAACAAYDRQVAELTGVRNGYKAAADRLKAKARKYTESMARLQSATYGDGGDLYREAVARVRYLRSIFPRFFIEVQNHGLGCEAYVMPLLVRLARELGIPLIAANDAHMATEADTEARRIMRFKYFNRHQETGEGDAELYVKDDAALAAALGKIIPADAVGEAMAGLSILGECRVVRGHGPHHPKASGGPSFMEALMGRRAEMEKNGEWSDVYEARLRHEVGVIESMGFVDYHMVVRDFCHMGRVLGCVPREEIPNIPRDFSKAEAWVKKKGFVTGVGVGPGRGSAAGSLCCYMLGITDIDPIRYGLLFERFLNPERVSMPDIDTDIKTSLRPTLIRYIRWKYGERAVCSIMTENTYAAKGALQQAGRDRAGGLYGGLPTKERVAKVREYMAGVYAVSDRIPETPGVALATSGIDPGTLGPEMRKVWDAATLIEGRLSSTGVHAGGIVISDNDDICDYVPLAWTGEVWAAQCGMGKIEERGLLKMDLLGLSTLDCISDTLHSIYARTGVAIDITKIPFEPEVFAGVYAAGDTNSVFQVEGMRDFMVQLRPRDIGELTAGIALYRPGPMDFIPQYIEGKEHPEKVRYACPQLRPILEPTYGCIVYQEQVMQIVRDLAGYSYGRSDLVRRAMAKKKQDVMDAERRNFVYGNPDAGIAGCVGNGIPEDTAQAVYDEMVDFAKYAFNKSHAAAYAVTSYQTAWLKYHYPLDFLCAMFNNKEQGQFGPILSDCRGRGIRVLPPDINASSYGFTVEGGSIRFGLRGIRGIASPDAFVRGPYASFTQFLHTNTVDGAPPNRRVVEALVLSGAFDRINPDRDALMDAYGAYQDGGDVQEPPWGQGDRHAARGYEVTYLGSVIGEDPLGAYADDAAYGCVPFRGVGAGYVKIFGFVSGAEEKVSKKGTEMIRLSLQGKDGGTCTAILTHGMYARYAGHTEDLVNEVLLIEGRATDGGAVFPSVLRKFDPAVAEYGICIRDMGTYTAVRDILRDAHPGGVSITAKMYIGENGEPLRYPVARRMRPVSRGAAQKILACARKASRD